MCGPSRGVVPSSFPSRFRFLSTFNEGRAVMIRRFFSRSPSLSAKSPRARLRRAKQARWRQQRRLSLETLEARYLLTEIPSLSDAQATYQATMTTLWSQAETAA